MSLRDHLAKRLQDAYGQDGFLVGAEISEFDRFRMVASECIRQMEWARHDAMREFVSDSAAEVRKDLTRLPLTLAPPDWKPE